MAFKISIRNRIIATVLSITITIFVVTIGYMVSATREIMLRDAYRTVRLNAENSAMQVRCKFEHYMGLCNGLAKAFEESEHMPQSEWQPLFFEMIKRVYKEYPALTSLWTSYEYNVYIPGYNRPYGRLYQQVSTKSNGEISWDSQELSMEGDPLVYARFKAKNYPSIFEPYLDVVSMNEEVRTLMTSVAVPIQREGRFAGLVGVDISLDWLQSLVKIVRPFEGSEAFMLSSNGVIAAHPRDSLRMKPLEALFPEETAKEELRTKIKDGCPASFMHVDGKGKRYYVHLAPVRIEKGGDHWSVGVCVPLNMITASADTSARVGLFAGLIAIVVLVIVLMIMSDGIARPIEHITEVLRRLGRGELDVSLKQSTRSDDEIDRMGQALNSLIDGLWTKNALAQSIGNGDLSQDIPLLSYQDTLGKSLVAMRDSLRKARAEEEARAQDNALRAWASDGLSQFNELLRANVFNLNDLCERVLARLAQFLDASMGAIYLLKETTDPQPTTERTYSLYTAYAWGRKRYLERAEYEEGVGLVGSCALERKPVFLTEIPDDYMHIPVGVGEVMVKSVVLLPLLHDEMPIGVLELAKSQPFEQHELSFLEDVCRAIAASIYSMQMSGRTKALLEQSREQAEMLASQEEELRQNLEELYASQEESQRKREEIEGLFEALGNSLYYIEFDSGGYITGVSESYLHRIKRRRDLVINTHFSDWIAVKGWGKHQFEQFWREVCNGKGERLHALMSVMGDEIPVMEFYIPVRNRDGELVKVVKLSFEE